MAQRTQQRTQQRTPRLPRLPRWTDGGRALAGLVLAGLVGLAGCLGSGRSDDAGGHGGPSADSVPSAAASAAPFLCDASRPAVAHGAAAAERPAGLRILACSSKTGHVSREPTIGVTASGAVFHYPAMVADNTRPTGVAVSRDHGRSWNLVMPALMGVPTHPSSLDPYLYVDPWTDRVFTDDLANPFCSYASWSDDEGGTWDHTVAGCLESDHQTIFAGPPRTSSPTGYANVVYRCAMNAVALGGGSTLSTCQKSLDGGRTWLPPESPAYTALDGGDPANPCDAALGHGISDLEGIIYVPKGHCGLPQLAISDDEGATWRRSVVSAEVGSPGHETGIAVDREGNLYYSWVSNDDLPYLSHSVDGGATWSEPLMVGPPGLTDAVFPEIYAGAPGRVVLAYMGSFQEASAPDRTYEAMMTVTYDALGDDPTFYSAAINDRVTDAYIVGGCCGGLQDFLDVRIAPDGTAWAAFVDDCIGFGMDCSEFTEPLDTQRVGVAAWLLAPSLWDAADPNGPYP